MEVIFQVLLIFIHFLFIQRIQTRVTVVESGRCSVNVSESQHLFLWLLSPIYNILNPKLAYLW